jgi:hypothetical protein
MCYNACKIQVRALHGAGIGLNCIVRANKDVQMVVIEFR